MNKFRLAFGLLFLIGPAFASSVVVQDDQYYQRQVFEEVNKYRQSKGLKPLKLNTQMSTEATIHSQDMASHRMGFGHKDFDKRIKRLFNSIQQCRSGAENVAYFKISPREVVHKWLTSPGHRRNIEGNFNLTGVGVARDSKGWVYYTQIFLRSDRA